MHDRQCEECGTTFTAKTKRAKYCQAACRVKANRRPSKTGAAKEAGSPQADPGPEAAAHRPGELAIRVIADLAKADVLDTIPGRAAVALAGRIESPMESGSAAASMTRELSRLVEEAKDLAPRAQDGIDDIEESVGAKLRVVK